MNIGEQTGGGTKDKRLKEVAKKRVLVIDDDLPIRGMLAAALRQYGFQVLLAGDGADPLIVSARTHGEPSDADGISLFLVDARAPGVSRRGYRTQDHQRAADLRFDAVRVEALQADAEMGRERDFGAPQALDRPD